MKRSGRCGIREKQAGNGNLDNRKNRCNSTTRDGLDEEIQFYLRHNKIGREQPIRTRESFQQSFPDLLENIETIKDTELKIQLKPGHYPVNQKARPVTLQL